MEDKINHPSHYSGVVVNVECNMIKRYLPADLSDAFKYIWRAGRKGDPIEDLKKAIWYLDDSEKFPVAYEESNRKIALSMFLLIPVCESKRYNALLGIVSGVFPVFVKQIVFDMIHEYEEQK